MLRYRLALVAGCFAFAVVLLLWIGASRDSDAPAGVVVEPAGKADQHLPVPAPSAWPAPVETAANVEDSDQLYQLVRDEPRDVAWAGRIEGAVRATLATTPVLQEGSVPEVRCATSVCEVNGIVSTRASPEELRELWEALRRRATDPSIAAGEIRPAAFNFGNGRNLYAFTLYYRRTDR